MPDFSHRSRELEIMDDFHLDEKALQPVLLELDTINRLLGGYAVFYDAFQQMDYPQNLHICDWGCGGGDTLIKLAKWARRKNLDWTFTGIDATPATVYFARENTKYYHEISIELGDVLSQTHPPKTCDVVISSLFTHHFADEDWVKLIRQKTTAAKKAVIINDLHRHPFAYYAIKWLTRFLSKSYMVRHDAPLSVLRGFTRKELILLLKKAGIQSYTLRWKWAFRWQLIIYIDKEKSVSA